VPDHRADHPADHHLPGHPGPDFLPPEPPGFAASTPSGSGTATAGPGHPHGHRTGSSPYDGPGVTALALPGAGGEQARPPASSRPARPPRVDDAPTAVGGSRPPPASRRVLAAALVAAALTGVAGGVAGAQLAVPGVTGPPGVTLPRSPGPVVAAPGAGLADVAAGVLPSVVSIEVRGTRGSGTGSGFVLDDRGHVLTNAHVVSGSRQVQVAFADGRRSAAEVVGTDTATDIAVLRVQAGTPPPLPLGVSADLRVGEAVLAVGSPLGLSGTVTSGIVSAVDREPRRGAATIQTDAPINPGNSGGPLLDVAGRVVGINTSIASLGSGNIGIGFAVPIDRAAAVAERLLARG
jgi:putative serine protease PepD